MTYLPTSFAALAAFQLQADTNYTLSSTNVILASLICTDFIATRLHKTKFNNQRSAETRGLSRNKNEVRVCQLLKLAPMSQTEGSNPPPPQLPSVPFPNCSHQPKPRRISIKLNDRCASGKNSLIQCNSDTGGETNVVEKANYKTHFNAKPDQSPHCQITDLVPTPLQTSTPNTPHTRSQAPRAFNLKHSLVSLPITLSPRGALKSVINNSHYPE
jgi:hypothetical protein